MACTVLFDLDGTLLDTLQDLAAACNHALTAMGLPTHPTDAYRQMVGSGRRVLVQRFLPPQNQGEATVDIAERLFIDYYDKHAEDNTAPYPGIPGMLQKLQAGGNRLFVFSNKPDENVQQVVARFFPACFTAVRGNREGMPPKPDPSGLFSLAEEYNIDLSNCVYVGDSDVDVQTAHNAGLPCVGVTWGFRGRDELQAAGAEVLAEDAAALQSILEKWPNK